MDEGKIVNAVFTFLVEESFPISCRDTGKIAESSLLKKQGHVVAAWSLRYAGRELSTADNRWERVAIINLLE